MAYLYLNFLDNLDKGLGDKAWGRNDFFTQSLNEQYEALKRKLGGYAPDTLQEFIGYTFPSTPKYYNVSLPSFDRTMDENKRGNKILRNIVIRPEVDGYSSYVLPETYDFMVIGDVTFGNVTEISVKGIDLIDRRTVKYGESEFFVRHFVRLQRRKYIAEIPEIRFRFLITVTANCTILFLQTTL